MNHAWLHLVVIAAGLSLLTGAQNAGTAVNKPGPEDGTIVNSIYANEFLGFSYPIPDGWEVNSEVGSTAPEVKAKRLSEGGLVLLVVDQHKGRPLRNRIVLSALDASGFKVDSEGFVTKFVRAQLGREGMELVRDTFPVNFVGKHFFREDYKESSAGGALYKAFVCTKFRGYFLGWTLAAGSPEELEESANSLQRISFREDQQASTSVAGVPPGTVPGDHSKSTNYGTIASATQQPNAERPQRVRVSEGVAQGLLIKRVQPEYPPLARVAGIQGNVVLKVLIGKDGRIKELTLVSGPPMLAPASVKAVEKWEYKPYLLNGEPVEVETRTTVVFQLSTH